MSYCKECGCWSGEHSFYCPFADDENKVKPETKTKGRMCNMFSKIIAYEMGELRTEDEIVDFFQELIDSGLAWKLQGHYGRTASHLIREGLCYRPLQEEE